jgi:hypothetical protein
LVNKSKLDIIHSSNKAWDYGSRITKHSIWKISKLIF